MVEMTNSKKWGIGSLSLIIAIFSIMFSFTFINGKYIGEHILNGLGVSFPIGIISLALFCASILIGHKYKNDYLAKSGKIVSIIFILLIIILSIISSLF
ncbi:MULTISPECIES: hypothetical protein [Clostridium]|uniref:Uncharacterized protein n=2 Tax=Clostridium TaxID=1485 RepID=D8GQX0_CLOLD|nr:MULTISPECIES: hypothetical protein [Clostridium]ADK16275.1 hypothetical protein CLJU_c32280 [Clostridium ljungdahlii DSM 13528]AGY75381.1 hypothetical protein CAETHG_1156 [Clostridium autoethanogenum DSM 10061]ALU35547.1 Hypothetical protein CLAU_1118 [Clostridium autoethanogenum DSM 10061]OAA89855.1 hypothetical protein WX45_01693 [Clostridium ljungdahlii DSM 13528]OVY52391.1 hypothetical protein WX72_01289 [Clostridium autoethanogenum]